MTSYNLTPPFDQVLFDQVVTDLQPLDPVVVSFMKGYLIFVEANRKYSRGSGPPPVEGDPLVSPRPVEEVRLEADRLERAYTDVYNFSTGKRSA